MLHIIYVTYKNALLQFQLGLTSDGQDYADKC